jgi:hypothetical protein
VVAKASRESGGGGVGEREEDETAVGKFGLIRKPLLSLIVLLLLLP